MPKTSLTARIWIIVGLGGLATFVIALLLYPSFIGYLAGDYAILIIEVCIGIIITAVVYYRTRKSETEVKKIVQYIRDIVTEQQAFRQTQTRDAKQKLLETVNEIGRLARESIRDLQTLELPQGSDLDALTSGLNRIVKISKNLTDSNTASTSFLSVDYVDELRTFAELCSKLGEGINETTRSTCESISREADRWIDRLSNELGVDNPQMTDHTVANHAEAIDKRQLEGAQLLTVSADRTVYPLDSTIHVRVKISELVAGEKVTCKILDRKGSVLLQGMIDPAEPQNDELAQNGIFEATFKMKGGRWKVGHKYVAHATYGQLVADDIFTIEQRLPILQSDKDVYLMGGDIIVTVIDPDADQDSAVPEYVGDRRHSRLVIESAHGKIDGYRLEETDASTGIFQGLIRVLITHDDGSVEPTEFDGKTIKKTHGVGPEDGFIACRRGEEIRLKYTSRAGTAELAVCAADFGAAIDLDKKAYTCTDKVRITVFAPDFSDQHRLSHIGTRTGCQISIRTGAGEIARYRLDEDGPATGIFTGEIRLDGFPELGNKVGRQGQFGATGGTGPHDGILACMARDEVKVVFDAGHGETYEVTAPVRWNLGQVNFLKPSYPACGPAAVRVIDPDMSLDPDATDEFPIRVWSDSDEDGIEIIVKETEGPPAGTFEGTVFLDPDAASHPGTRLRASEGDTVHAEYADFTLPDPYAESDSLRIEGTALVSSDGKALPPLEMVRMAVASVLNERTGLIALMAGDPVLITLSATNRGDHHSFDVILQATDSSGIHRGLQSASLGAGRGKTVNHTFRWTPPEPGLFTLTMFCWKSVNDPAALAPPVAVSVNVVESTESRE